MKRERAAGLSVVITEGVCIWGEGRKDAKIGEVEADRKL